jgi:MYXO-CTERM domain-containing protein
VGRCEARCRRPNAVTLVGGVLAILSMWSAILGGTPTVDDAAVVGLAYQPTSCGASPIAIHCTGVVIAPRVVLTAAHCLGGNPPNAIGVFFGEVLDASTASLVPVVGGRAHPGFDEATHANDIAVLILASDAAGVTPLAIQRDPLPDLSGQSVRIVGYGIDDIASTAIGIKREGMSRITQIDANDVRTEPAPAMSCHGDSGGPILAGSPEVVIAVATWGDPACAQFGVAARLDPYAAFVQSIVDEAEVSPMRRVFDPGEAFCASSCNSDNECPAQTVCFGLSGADKHCVYRGLPAGELGDACTSATECEDACVRVGDGCLRFIPCDREPSDHCAPSDDGCGCTAPGGSPSSLMLGLLAMAYAARRPTRCARRTATTRDARALLRASTPPR